MDEWQLLFTKQAEKDARKIASSGLSKQVNKLLDIIKKNPYQTYPIILPTPETEEVIAERI